MPALPLSSVAFKQPFNVDGLANIISKRNTRYHLDLSTFSLVGVLQSYQAHKRKMSPKFVNTAVVGKIKELQNLIGEDIMPIDVCDDFYMEFYAYLESQGLKPSTIRNYFDQIRAALVWGAQHKCPLSETYKDYKMCNYSKTKVALTPSQISHIYYYEVDKHHKELRAMADEMGIRRFSFTYLKKVQAQFVLQCNIGQRYSDACRVDKTMFDDTRTILSLIQQKTGNKATVNLSKYAIDKAIVFEILRNYDYTAPLYNHAIGQFNKCLHCLLRCIGGEFNQLVKSENKISGAIVTESRYMWQAIA